MGRHDECFFEEFNNQNGVGVDLGNIELKSIYTYVYRGRIDEYAKLSENVNDADFTLFKNMDEGSYWLVPNERIPTVHTVRTMSFRAIKRAATFFTFRKDEMYKEIAKHIKDKLRYLPPEYWDPEDKKMYEGIEICQAL